MILPGGFRGAAFGTADEGDLRNDGAARTAAARSLGISPEWATVRQVHGNRVVEADAAGDLGEADAIITRRPGLPAAVATADCVPVIIEAEDAVAVVHAGWRGAAAGVVQKAAECLAGLGSVPVRAAIGPAIGPCCYEVGPEVVERFPDHAGTTSWGSPSVDLAGFVAAALGDIEIWASGECTFTSDELHSYRRDRTQLRQVAVGWLPNA
jgi:YfiH family protein